jgi:Protein of unknown function (DUF2817)
MTSYFSKDYDEARTRFVDAVQRADGILDRFAHDAEGPDGGALSTDIAWFGDADALSVFVTVSGTHGVEGFFGSAVQTAWLERREHERLPKGTAALLIHAINPYGFAWLRRTNEDNVDVNRNWVDFDDPLPPNAGYDELSDDLCPTDWSAKTQKETGERIADWIKRNGPARFQQVVTSGQWRHPQGLFFGGTSPSWSRKVMTEILQTRLREAQRVLILDFHTGLGPSGYVEPIVHDRPADPGFERTRSWIGASATSVYGGSSVSAEVVGDGLSAVQTLLPHAVVDAVSLECGTRPMDEVGQGLRADAWLHAHGDPTSPAAAPIKALIRNAFHSDDPTWQGMAVGQGLWACRAAVGGLPL